MQILLDNLGVGWTFTLFAGLCAATTPLLLAERRWGMQWRKIREWKAEERRKRKAGKDMGVNSKGDERETGRQG